MGHARFPELLAVLAAAGALSLVPASRGLAAADLAIARATAASPSLVVALQQPPATPDEFVPVDTLPVQEQLPAAPLLIGAYSFVWVMLIAYVVFLWRRLGGVEREIESLQRQITPASTGEARRIR